MQLKEIDKNSYQKRYKMVFAAIVAILISVSLLSSTLLISWLSTPNQSNFILNLAGVVIAAIVASYLLYHFRKHPFMNEVVYVWNLKKQLNSIYRKQHKIEPLIDENNKDAMIIMNYMYQGSKQLYELDNNTITMNDLTIKINHLNTKITENNFTISTDDYQTTLLSQF